MTLTRVDIAHLKGYIPRPSTYCDEVIDKWWQRNRGITDELIKARVRDVGRVKGWDPACTDGVIDEVEKKLGELRREGRNLSLFAIQDDLHEVLVRRDVEAEA